MVTYETNVPHIIHIDITHEDCRLDDSGPTPQQRLETTKTLMCKTIIGVCKKFLEVSTYKEQQQNHTLTFNIMAQDTVAEILFCERDLILQEENNTRLEIHPTDEPGLHNKIIVSPNIEVSESTFVEFITQFNFYFNIDDGICLCHDNDLTNISFDSLKGVVITIPNIEDLMEQCTL